MKRFLSALLAVAMVLSLSACKSGGSGKNIVYPISVSPYTLDPQYAKDSGAQLIINNIFEGLVRHDAEGKIIPGIATKWETSKDGLTWTFHLQDGTEWYCPSSLKNLFGDDFYKKFSTETVKARDFVFACQRTVDPQMNSSFAHRMLVIQNASEIIAGEKSPAELGVTATDDNTLVFRLTEPCKNFLDRLTENEFMPCNQEFFAAMNGRYGIDARHIICNGPFYVSSWDPENTMTCKVNKYYAGSQTVLPSSVIFAFANSNEDVLAKLQSGNLSCALLPPESKLPENITVEKELRDTVYGLVFNCKDPVLVNGNIRKALCMSINRKLFDVGDENHIAQSGLIPPVCTAVSENYRSSVKDKSPAILRDVKKAQALYAKGLEKLEIESTEFTVLCTEQFEIPLKTQFQTWQKLFGLDFSIKVKVMEANEITKAVNDGDFQIALAGIQSTYTDSTGFISQFRDGDLFNYNSKNFKEIVDNLLKAEVEKDVIDGCFAAEEYLLQQGVCYPLYTKASRFVVSKDVGDIYMLGSEDTICFINAKRYD
ncbi:MAG: peptide ABC transporter substrate-binding protein [Clostridia bacterium]|nr:peptide ABC transporter substrate-binding protein [Clostridia bacterium]